MNSNDSTTKNTTSLWASIPVCNPWMLWKLAFLWLCMLLPSMGIWIQSRFWLAWEQRPLDLAQVQSHPDFRPFGYVISIGSSWQNQNSGYQSPARILEDGYPLTMPNSPHAEIGQKGEGRFSLWDRCLIFSTSDNSDPRTNGHCYVLDWPWEIKPLWIGLAHGVALLATALLVLLANHSLGWRRIHGALATTIIRLGLVMYRISSSLWVDWLVFAIPFMMVRFWLVADYWFPVVNPDSFSYYMLTETMESGEWPPFTQRPPVYPLFLRLCYALFPFHGSDAMVGLQHGLSLASGLFLIFAVHHIRKWLALGVAVVLAGYHTSFASLLHDGALLSESVYTSFIVFAFAFIILGLLGRSIWPFVYASTCVAVAIMIRPAGMFLLGTLLLVVFYAWRNRWRWTAWTSIVIPVSSLLLILAAYNYAVTGGRCFAVSTHGEQTYGLMTLPFWEPNPQYPENINATVMEIHNRVRELQRDKGIDPDALETATDPQVITKYFYPVCAAVDLINLLPVPDEYEQNRWLRPIIRAALWKHRREMAKLVLAEMKLMYVDAPKVDGDYRSIMENYILTFFVKTDYVQSNYHVRRLFPKIAGSSRFRDPPVWHQTGEGTSAKVDLPSTPTHRLYLAVQKQRNRMFANDVWLYLFAGSLLAAGAILLWRKGSHDGAFMVILIGLSNVGACLIASVNLDYFRYAYPTQWALYACPMLLPLLGMPRLHRVTSGTTHEGTT